MTLQNILIVGGSGILGKELVSQLLQQGKTVHVMSRHAERMQSLTEKGVRVIKGDLTDRVSLAIACKGMDAVISAAHALLGKGKNASEKVDGIGQRMLIDAARNAGVKYFLFTSVVDASPSHELDFWRAKAKAESYLKQSGLTYNIIRPTAFFEVHVKELIGKSILKNGKVTIFGKGENLANFVAVQDVAQLMLLCIDQPDKHNQTFEIGGKENVSRKQIVQMYAAKTGKPVKESHIPPGVLRFLSSVIKPFHPGITRVMRTSEFFDRADQAFDVTPLLKTFPLKMTPLDLLIEADKI